MCSTQLWSLQSKIRIYWALFGWFRSPYLKSRAMLIEKHIMYRFALPVDHGLKEIQSRVEVFGGQMGTGSVWQRTWSTHASLDTKTWWSASRRFSKWKTRRSQQEVSDFAEEKLVKQKTSQSQQLAKTQLRNLRRSNIAHKLRKILRWMKERKLNWEVS